ncbi:MAG: right-handed parallel beta-helix repeat-containing protein [Rhodanobacteraceae bacterium]|nr:right-handed parallel beta-helix repeat-containing protein [Rhodanobacteraceae bacterium]
MMLSKGARGALWLLLAGVLLLSMPVSAQLHDNWADARVITSLPYSDSDSTTTATTEASDPVSVCFIGAGDSQGRSSVWYRYATAAATEYLNLSTAGSSYDTVIQVYRGAPGSFEQVTGGCNDDGVLQTQSRIAGLRLMPNTTYWIEITSHGSFSGGGSLVFNASAAPVYSVTRTDDPNPAQAGCTPGDCSLRAAIKSSNSTPGAVVIPAGTYAISLGSTGDDANAGGDFDVKVGMGIYGAGMDATLIDAANRDRVFDIDPYVSGGATGKVTAIIADLALINGGGSSLFGDGGGIRAYSTNSSALLTNDYLALERVRVSQSRSQLNGGGLALIGRGTLRDSEFIGNYAGSTGGGLTLGPTLAGGDTTVEIIGTTIANNQSPGGFSGGGGIKSTARLRMVNSTVSGNTTGYHGGGLYLTGTGNIMLHNVTIAGNTAAMSSGSTANGAGLRIDSGSRVVVRNSVIADNTRTAAALADDCSGTGTLTTIDYSLLETGGGCAFTGSANLSGIDPELTAPLANNGGVTRTLLPATTSPVRDVADPAGCFDYRAQLLTTDQRGAGFPRGAGVRCDMGALELPASTLAAPGSPRIAAVDDSGSSTSDGVTRINQPRFEGTCADGSSITLLLDALPSGTSACASGVYMIAANVVLADGTHTATARAQLGSAISPDSSTSQVVIDTVAPVQAFTSAPQASTVGGDASFVFTGEASLPIECRLDTAAFSPCTSPLSFTGLAQGDHSLQLQQFDIAGNRGGVQHDWTALRPPAPSAPVLAPGSDTGSSPSDGITRAEPLLVRGSCSNGDLVQVVLDAAPLGGSQICIAEAYEVVAAGVAEGTHVFTVRASRGGLDSTLSAALTVQVDRTVPAAPSILTPDGYVGPLLLLQGTAEASATVEVRVDAMVGCTTAADGSGQWSCTLALSPGSHSVTARQTDLAGNVGSLGVASLFTVDRLFADGFEP